MNRIKLDGETISTILRIQLQSDGLPTGCLAWMATLRNVSLLAACRQQSKMAHHHGGQRASIGLLFLIVL